MQVSDTNSSVLIQRKAHGKCGPSCRKQASLAALYNAIFIFILPQVSLATLDWPWSTCGVKWQSDHHLMPSRRPSNKREGNSSNQASWLIRILLHISRNVESNEARIYLQLYCTCIFIWYVHVVIIYMTCTLLSYPHMHPYPQARSYMWYYAKYTISCTMQR